MSLSTPPTDEKHAGIEVEDDSSSTINNPPEKEVQRTSTSDLLSTGLGPTNGASAPITRPNALAAVPRSRRETSPLRSVIETDNILPQSVMDIRMGAANRSRRECTNTTREKIVGSLPEQTKTRQQRVSRTQEKSSTPARGRVDYRGSPPPLFLVGDELAEAFERAGVSYSMSGLTPPIVPPAVGNQSTRKDASTNK